MKDAEKLFAGTDVNVTHHGRKYLGGFIGDNASQESYCADIVSTWVKQIKTLSKIAYSEPLAPYTAFVSGLKHRFTYHLRTIPLLQNMLQPLDDVITNTLIPAISDGHMCSTV